MKTTRIVSNRPSIITSAFLLSLLMGITMLQSAYGAGSSSTPAPAHRPTHRELRQKANVQFANGERLMKQEKYKEASKAFKKAVRIDGKYAEAHSNLGYTYRKQNLYGKAVKSYRKAIKLKPKLAQAHEYLGEAYAEMKDFKKAEKELTVLRQLDSKLADKLEKFISDTKAGKQTDSKW